MHKSLPPGTPILGRAVRIQFAGWAPAVSRGLLALEAHPFLERDVFSRVTRSILEHRQKLIHSAELSNTGMRTGGLQDHYPLALTLGMFNGGSAAPATVTFLALALDLELGEPGNDDTRTLASLVRGLWNQSKDTPFAHEIACVTGLQPLVEALDALSRTGQANLHRTFFGAWSNRIRSDAIELLREAANDRYQTRCGLVSEGGELCDVSLETGPVVEDPQEVISVPELAEDEQYSPKTQVGLAKYGALARRSSTAIFRLPDDILPASLAHSFATRALEALRKAVESEVDDFRIARLVAVNLLVAVGLSESDCRRAILAETPFEDRVVIDARRSSVYRPEARPTGAAAPNASDSRWLATGGSIALAIPEALASCILMWLGKRGGAAAIGIPLMQDHVPTQAGWLPAAIQEIDPTFPTGWRVFRERIAAAISDKLGFEAAQISFGDSFSLSTGAAYYSRYPALSVAEIAWTATATVYGQDSAHLPDSFVPPAHHIGSRVAPSLQALNEVTSQFARGFRSAIRTPGAPSCADWACVRDYVALALMAATGHRPTSALAELKLGNFVLNHEIVLLQDKKVDPSHLTRVAALGTGCTQLLCTYIRLLQRIACSEKHPGNTLATRVLNGEQAIFTVSNDAGEQVPLIVAALMSQAGGLLAERPNMLRHALNQELIEQNVDPEIRHQQLGWLLTDASATSDCCPLAPKDFAKEVGPKIDEVLARHGWEFRSGPADIPALPMPSLMDWGEVLEEHAREQRRAIARLQQAWSEQRLDRLKSIAPKLHGAIALVMPFLCIEQGAKRSRLAYADHRRLPITARDVDSVVRLAMQGEDDAITEIAVRTELARLIREFRVRTSCPAHVPSVPRLSKSMEPSPFLPAAGIACRQIKWLRNAVLEEPFRWSGRRRTAVRAVLGVLLFSPVESIKGVLGIVARAGESRRGRNSSEIVRSPNADGDRHYALTGSAAAFLATAGKSVTHSLEIAEVVGILQSSVPELFPSGQDWKESLTRLQSTLHVARAFELSGIERCSLSNGLLPRSVDITRAIGAEDDWPSSPAIVEAPLRELALLVSSPPTDASSPGTEQQRASRKSGKNLLRVLAIFQKDYRGTLKYTGKTIADSTGNWRALIRHEISAAADAVVPRHDAAALIVRYAHHLSIHGGRRKKSGLQPSAIYTMLRRFVTSLDELASDADLTRLSHDEFETLYSQVILCHTKRARRRTFDELFAFHQFLRETCGVPELEWSVLRKLAGGRTRSSNPGLLTRAEVREIWNALLQDCNEAERTADCPPEELHVRRLRCFAFAVLASAGIRPDSVYGLTFADIRLTPSGDYVHLHRWGGYGSVKTGTSLGFIPLDGPDWDERRAWVKRFVDERVATLGGGGSLPVFGALGNPRERVSRPLIERRISELARWASGERLAEPYWLRKTCIHHRYLRLLKVRQSRRAREVHRVLRQCGHVRIDTPLESYLADPAHHVHRHLHADALVPVKLISDITGIAPGTIQQRMQRATTASVRDLAPGRRLSIALDCMKVPLAYPTHATGVSPPPCRLLRRSIGRRDTEQLVRDFIAGRSEHLAASHNNFNENGTRGIYARCRLFSAITGWSLGKTLAAPRPVRSAEAVRKLLNDCDALTAQVAEAWVVVSGRAGPDVCALPDEASQVHALTLLAQIGCECDVRRSGLLFILSGIRNKQHSNQQITSIWPTLRWVLTVAWIHLAWHPGD